MPKYYLDISEDARKQLVELVRIENMIREIRIKMGEDIEAPSTIDPEKVPARIIFNTNTFIN